MCELMPMILLYYFCYSHKSLAVKKPRNFKGKVTFFRCTHSAHSTHGKSRGLVRQKYLNR